MYKISILFIMMSSFIYAQSIDQQINAIKKAPAAQRAKLMNAFKVRLSNMNREERLEAITAMRSNMSSKHDTPVHNNMPIHHERMETMQMKNSEEMTSYQNMNQNQAGHQVEHAYSNGNFDSQNYKNNNGKPGSNNMQWRK